MDHRLPEARGGLKSAGTRGILDNVGFSWLERQARRRRTKDVILDAALDAMASNGVAGISLPDIARRAGLTPASLQDDFPDRMSIYDAVYKAGFEGLGGEMTGDPALADRDPVKALRLFARIFVRWCVEHPIHAQVMFSRPVPEFEPSAETYAVSASQLQFLRRVIGLAVLRGQLSPAAASDEGLALYTSVVCGIVSQQLANQPGVAYEVGRYSRATARGVDLWVSYYTPSLD